MKTHRYFLLPALLLVSCLHSFSQEIQPALKKEFDNTLYRWYSSTGNENTTTFEKLLTDDFQLLAFGKRFDKKETVEMMKDYSDVKYKLANVRYGSGGDMGYMTFDVELTCNWKGNPTKGAALETYLFKKVNNEWKVGTKVIVTMDTK